jgi:transcriptional regulator with XRE-family HTH domain
MSHQINIQALGEAILRHREQLKLTVRAAAEQMENVSSSTLSRIERGSLPDIDTYMRLCQWLGVGPAHFAIAPVGSKVAKRESPLSKEEIIVHLRADKLLNQPTRDALITMIEVAYAAARRNLLPNEAQSTQGIPDPC